MSSVVKFTATKLANSGKQGILKPDADGYYEMVIGGLNTLNSAQEFYTLEGAKELFEASSVFMRRVKNGCLKGEVGHPKRDMNLNLDAYINRILTIDEKNICVHFKEVWLDEQFGKNNPVYKNPNLVAIMAKLKPSGPKAAALQSSLDNPNENTCFSIRALTRDYFHRGQTMRVLTSIMTWDWVNEPGISIANKFDAPALESMVETTITRQQIERFANDTALAVATESSRQIALETLKALKQEKEIHIPVYAKW